MDKCGQRRRESLYLKDGLLDFRRQPFRSTCCVVGMLFLLLIVLPVGLLCYYIIRLRLVPRAKRQFSDLTIPDEAVKYILFQRTGYLSYPKVLCPGPLYKLYVMLESVFRKKRVKSLFNQAIAADYESIKSHLPSECSRILDIGCGVGGIDVMLHKHYVNIDFYLFDKTDFSRKIYYGFRKEAAFYNSLEITEEVLRSNGVEKERIHLLVVQEDCKINMEPGIDLVISLLSWGFHYPVSKYINQVYDILRDGGRLILDVRKKSGGEYEVADRFSRIEKISEGKKYIRVLAIKDEN